MAPQLSPFPGKKYFSSKKRPGSESTVDNQQSTAGFMVGFGESEVGFGGFVVGSAGSKPTSSESNSPKQLQQSRKIELPRLNSFQSNLTPPHVVCSIHDRNGMNTLIRTALILS